MVLPDLEAIYAELILPSRLEHATRMRTAIESLSGGSLADAPQVAPGLGQSLLCHILFACLRAKERDGLEMAYRALAAWDAIAGAPDQAWTAYGGRSWLILGREGCLHQDEIDKAFETPCYLVSPESLVRGLPTLSPSYWCECWTLLERTRLLPLVRDATEVIVHLQYREMSDSLTSYSLLPLVGTVFVDWTDSPLRHAESIVHEAAHSFLNMLLGALSVSTGGRGSKYYSPWRGVHRPAIGIVHGTWAFSIVHTFYARLCASDDDELLSAKQKRYCVARRDYEYSRLQGVSSSLVSALDDLGSETVKDIVLSRYPVAAANSPGAELGLSALV